MAADRFTEFPLTAFEEVLARADILVLLTNHTQFDAVQSEQLAGKVIIDPRGVWRGMESTARKEPLIPFLATTLPKRSVA